MCDRSYSLSFFYSINFCLVKIIRNCLMVKFCHRRYMAGILPIWRKTLSNQSINLMVKFCRRSYVPGILPMRRKTLSNQSILWWSFVTAVTWLEYCRYGVKHYPINQSYGEVLSSCRRKKLIDVRISEYTLVKKQMNRHKQVYILFWEDISREINTFPVGMII